MADEAVINGPADEPVAPVPAPVLIHPDIDTVLGYCGFGTRANRIAISNDGFASFTDIAILEQKDIEVLAKSFGALTVAAGKIVFGFKRSQLMKAMIHWVQDFSRISRSPSLDLVPDKDTFITQIHESLQRAKMRDNVDSDKFSVAAEPGKLKGQKVWLIWERSFQNYLSTILGQSGVPLSYVIRASEAPDYSDEADGDFDALSILCAPLKGLVFKVDATKVHQLLHGFVQGEVAETWIKPKEKKKNGRIDFLALQDHYGGHGNKTIRIKEAESLRKTLLYKNERIMTFDKFLTAMQTMFTGFEENDEHLSAQQKVRLLFDKVQHTLLETTKASLLTAYQLYPDAKDDYYNFIANSLSAEVVNLPDYSAPTRQASGVDSGGGSSMGKGQGPVQGIRSENGTIYTGFYNAWQKLSAEDKQAVMSERDRLKITHQKSSRRSGNNRRASSVKKTSTLAKAKRKISSLQTQLKEAEKKVSFESSDAEDDAGNSFGGRSSKKKNKSA